MCHAKCVLWHVTCIKESMIISNFIKEARFLSNFAISPNTPPTVEHWYQAAKATNLADRQLISEAKTPGEAKRLARRIPLRKDWDRVKDDIMLSLVRAKFTDPELRAKLVATGSVELVEGNHWHDNYWGSCWCLKCHGVEKQNKLGKILMLVRSECETKNIQNQ